jgi:hypothetical protein
MPVRRASVIQNRDPFELPSKPGHASSSPAPRSQSQPNLLWTQNLLQFVAMIFAAYLALPTLLLLDGLFAGNFMYLREVANFGLGTALAGFLVFPWPLLIIYAIAIGIILSATSSFKVRCALCVPALLVYSAAVYIRFGIYCVAG